MIAHLLWLQLPFVYLPLLVVGLAIYGADFEHPSGRIYLWTPLVLAVLHSLLRHFGRVLAKREVSAAVLILGAAVVAYAYRPLHMSWWDERSTSQAAHILAIGVCSVFASQLGARRVTRAGGPDATHAACAFAVLALIATGGMLYPMIALLALAPLMAAGAAVDDEAPDAPRAERPATRFGGWRRYAVLLAGIELSLPLWDFQTDPRWALFLGLGLLGVAAGVVLAARRPLFAVLLPAFATVWTVAAAFDSAQTVCPMHALLVGAGTGWLLRPLFEARAVKDEPASLAWCTPVWIVGILLGYVLAANRSIMGLRLLFWLPLLIPLLGVFRNAPSRPSGSDSRPTT
ncbi:MAG: hypothetical protein H6831_08895 [Planctomycetes bacterium]|nr:hypothetical protein [Planctomycetota bacterium]MCB9904508.1 hypothetical protein [Planctomycetota bacterium]